MAGAGSTLIDLMTVQAGRETTWGTAVTATVKRMGVTDLKIDPGMKGEKFHDRRGSIAPTYLAALTEIMPEGKLEEIATYEDCVYSIESLLGIATPSGAGPYTRAYNAPITTVATPRWQTINYGDSTNSYRLFGGTTRKLTIKGSNGKPITFESDIFGKGFEAQALATLNDRTVQVVMGDHVSIFIDAWGGTIGTTQLDCTAFEFELEIDPKREPDQFFGSLTPCNYHEADGAEGWDATLKLKLEFNATSKAQFDALISPTTLYQRQVRISAGSGTNVLRFDYAGYSEKAPTYGEDRSGVLTYEVMLKPQYNTTLGNWLKAQIVNSVATVV